MTFTPSIYQEAIFDFVRNGRGDAVVNAVAGSGKTTTIVDVSKFARGSALFCAFNKSIVGELKDRLGAGVACKTINGIGHGALMTELGPRMVLDDTKYKSLIQEETALLVAQDVHAVRSAIAALVSFAQCSLCETTDEGLADLVARYGIELPISDVLSESYFYDVTRSVLENGAEIARSQKVISFNDQLWLPALWDLPCRKYDFVFVDEIQDLSRAKLDLVLKSRGLGGRIIGVGDPRQSIYGFAGADPRAWQEIISRTDATVLPLSVCYRCPRKVIELAKGIVPEIEAADNAPEGVVETINETDLADNLSVGDLVLCRITAPLVRLCIDLIRQRIPARVKGRDISRSLITLAKEALRGGSWDDFPELLEQHVAKKSASLAKKKNGEGQAQALRDRADGLLACYDAFNAANFFAFQGAVEGLFTDGSAAVELSTVHKAKGLQAKRVFIMLPEMLGNSKWAKQDWEREQEQNLKYVALTRAQEELYFVRSNGYSGKKKEAA